VSVVGVIAGGAGQPDDGVAMDADEAPGLSDAVALGEVMEDGMGLLVGHPAVKQRGALSFGEAGLAGPTVEQPDVVVLAVAVADGQVAGAAFWVEVQEIDEMLDILRHLIAICSVIQGHHQHTTENEFKHDNS
jgi:hypothetical protein